MTIVTITVRYITNFCNYVEFTDEGNNTLSVLMY